MLTKLNSYVNTANINVDNIELVLDAVRLGFLQATITNWDTDDFSAITAGSLIEVNGALYKAITEQTVSMIDPVTGTLVLTGWNWLVINGTTGAPSMTATAPIWSDTKQGWYGTGVLANSRYIIIMDNVGGYAVWEQKDWLKKPDYGLSIIQGEWTFFHVADDYQTIEIAGNYPIDNLGELLNGKIKVKRGGMYFITADFGTNGVNSTNTFIMGASINRNGSPVNENGVALNNTYTTEKCEVMTLSWVGQLEKDDIIGVKQWITPDAGGIGTNHGEHSKISMFRIK
jgi:hypothetical protein